MWKRKSLEEPISLQLGKYLDNSRIRDQNYIVKDVSAFDNTLNNIWSNREISIFNEV